MSSIIPRTSGIYQIRCIPTGKVYIGSSVNLQRRWRQHRETLERRYAREHENSYLQHAWDKYGADAFEFTILELAPLEILLEREQYWIDHTRCYERDKGFNRRLRAESDIGVKREGRALENIRQAAAQRRGKPVPPWSSDRHEIHRQSQLARRGRPFTEEHRQKLSEAKRGKSRAAAVVQHFGDMIRAQFAKLSPEERAARHAGKADLPTWVITDPDGAVYRTVNLSAFCEEHGLNRSSMGSVARGGMKSYRGWTVRRDDIS